MNNTTLLALIKNSIQGFLKNKATGSYSLSIEGTGTTRNGATNVGNGSVADGYRASSYGNNASVTAQEAIAIGFNANATAQNAIQIGAGTNDVASSLQIGNNQLLDGDGKIPDARINHPVPDGTGHLGEFLMHETTGEFWNKVSASSIDSGVSANKTVLMADGNGNAAFTALPIQMSFDSATGTLTITQN